MAVVCLLDPSNTSGALYQSVTTLGVMSCTGNPKVLARPKSAEVKNNIVQGDTNGAFFYFKYQLLNDEINVSVQVSCLLQYQTASTSVMARLTDSSSLFLYWHPCIFTF